MDKLICQTCNMIAITKCHFNSQIQANVKQNTVSINKKYSFRRSATLYTLEQTSFKGKQEWHQYLLCFPTMSRNTSRQQYKQIPLRIRIVFKCEILVLILYLHTIQTFSQTKFGKIYSFNENWPDSMPHQIYWKIERGLDWSPLFK